MTLPAWQWCLIGAGIGWVGSALCFWLIDAWRGAPEIMMMSDDALMKHAAAVKAELLYRFPSSGGTVDDT